MRRLKETPLALTVGSQTLVRKVLREIGVPAVVANSRSSRPEGAELDVLGDRLKPGLADGEGSRLVVVGVSLGDEPLAGRGVLPRHLDDGVLDGDCSA